MTLPARDRQADRVTALLTMVAELGDRAVGDESWQVSRSDFAALIPTTFPELEEAGYVRQGRVFGPPTYELTEEGWLAGLQASGAFESEALRERCVALVKFFKAQIAGRRESALVDLRELPPGLPDGWVLNALGSGLLAEMFPGKRMNATLGVYLEIAIPQTFGMPRD